MMFLGIDIGGTTGRVSAFDSLDSTAELAREEFKVTKWANADFVKDFSELIGACIKLESEYGHAHGIGLALAGKVNSTRKQITSAGTLTHWVGQPVVDLLSDAFKCPIRLGNDAEAAALAEAYYGHGRESDFWFMIWGTGIGGCLVRYIDGKPIALAGEPGHQRIRFDGLKCNCGQFDCLEAYAGGGNLEKRFGRPAQELDHEWSVIRCAVQAGVRNVVTSQPVPLVVFGGGVANKQRHLLDIMQASLKSELLIVDPPEIKLSAFGESTGTVGALALLNR